MFVECEKIRTVDNPRRTAYSAHSILCGVVGHIQVTMDMERIPVMNILVNLLNPTGHVMHQQFNIQQLYVLPTLYLCVLYLSENKQRLVPLTA